MSVPPTNAERAKCLRESAGDDDLHAYQKEMGGPVVAETHPSARKLRADAQRKRKEAQQLEDEDSGNS